MDERLTHFPLSDISLIIAADLIRWWGFNERFPADASHELFDYILGFVYDLRSFSLNWRLFQT